MITSEVQRTLVKSPPELWSELSDPESLARHLGELGEVAITRVEPENLVEWEAEGTTGTVEIEPSGWGTRVTLTVLRELPADEAAGPAGQASSETELGEPASAPAPEPLDETPAEAEEQPWTTTEPEVAEDPAAATEAAEQATTAQTAAEADPEPQLSGGPEAADPPQDGESQAAQAPERKPAPATEAARRAAGWPPIAPEHDPAIESDPRAAEAAEEPDHTDGLHAWAAQAAIEPAEPVAQDEPIATEPAASGEPRRGFFARLFGRRARRSSPADTVEDLDMTAEDVDLAAVEEPDVAGKDPGPAPVEDIDIAALDPDPIDEALDLPEPDEEPVLDGAERADDADVSGDEQPEQRATDAASPAPASDSDPLADDQPLAETTRPDRELTPTGAADGQAAAPDLSAELKAAEEVAAGQVTAVLSAVLDRLGSAHHRPFSRP